jgi:hypothetical protein
MAAKHGVDKKKLVKKTIFFGALSALLYGTVFTHTDLVTQLYTKGGAYAALPIATAFIFSFVHGAFTGNVWSILGIEAITKQPAQRPEVRPERPAQRPRPRVRMTA